ncbi:MAG: hypothetical protein AB7E79_13665 [Rhodospirillaceae bacterium]
MTVILNTYRLRAAECLEQARRARDEDDKAAFLEMAEEWLSLAASRDAVPPPAPVFTLVG